MGKDINSNDHTGHSVSRREFVAASGAALSTVGLAGCLGGDSGPEGGLTIGFYGPMTGPADDIGEHKQQAVDMAVDIINENGGVGGEDIEVIYGDSESEPTSGVNAVSELIQNQHCDVIGGGFHSDVALATVEVTNRHDVPQIIDEAVSAAIVDKINDEELWNVFKTAPPSQSYADGWKDLMEDFAEAETGYFPYDDQTIALISEDTSYGLSIADLMEDELDSIGWEVISEDEVSLDETDFTSLLARIQDDDPDVVWSVQTSTSGTANLVQQFDEAGFEETHLLDNFGLSNPAAIEAAGDSGNGVITLANAGPFEEALNEWNALEEWDSRYDEMMWGSGALAFQNIIVIAEYVETMGGPEALRDAGIDEWRETVLEHDPVPGGTGYVQFQDNHQAAWGTVDDQPQIGYQILDGDMNTVWPFETAPEEIDESVY